MPPYGVRPPKRDVFAHFRSVREAVDLHIMLYNVPGTSGIDFTPEEVQQLAEEGVDIRLNGQRLKSGEFAIRSFSVARDSQYLWGTT